MKNRIFLSIILSFIVSSFTLAQTPPVLKRYYPLDNLQGTEKVGQYNGTLQGQAETFQDRFGNPNGAIKLTNDSYMSIPSLLGNFNYKETGFTVSFWLYIDENLVKRHGKTPWLDTDPAVRAYGAKKGQVPMLGFYRRGDRAVIDRYTTDVNGQTNNWSVWLWDPINFTQRSGWYQIIISHEKSRTFVYSFFPTTQIEGSIFYFGIQDMDAATKWFLGNDAGKSLILDDFKVYQGTATQEQARQMYAGEALPKGMYTISICADKEELVHTVSHNITEGTLLEIDKTYGEGDRNAFKWVVSPWADSTKVFAIRMAYSKLYMHIATNQAQQSAPVDIVESMYPDWEYSQWRIEPAGDGYFYIKAQADPNKYLHTANHYFTDGARLEILDFVSSYAPVFKWKFNLIKTLYEMEHGVVKNNEIYETILSDNTFLGMTDVGPTVESTVPVYSQRSPFPSLLNYWKFSQSWDGSYEISNASFYTLYLRAATGIKDHEPMITFPYSMAENSNFTYVVEKPNKYGRRVIIKQAINQKYCIGVSKPVSKTRVTLENKESESVSKVWALYANNPKSPNANIQVYDLKPGMYRIVSAADGSKSITTRNYQWTSSTDLVLKSTTVGDRYTSHYWVVDYERDNNGNPVLDGTYTIQLFATDKLYFHTKSHALASSAKLEIYILDRDHLDSEKWFINPHEMEVVPIS